MQRMLTAAACVIAAVSVCMSQSESEGRILFCAQNQVLSARPDGTDREVLASADMAMQAAAQSFDGSILAWVRGTTLIHHLHLRLDDGAVVHADVVRGRHERFGPLSFRPQSRQLLYSATGQMKLLDFDTGEKVSLGLGDRPQWLAAGPEFVYETGARPHDEEIGIHLTSPGDAADELIVPFGTQAVPSPDGSVLAYVYPAQDDDPRVYTRAMATGDTEELEGTTRFDRPIAISPDNATLLVNRADLSSPDGALRFDLLAFDLRSGAVTTLDSGATDSYRATFAPNGTEVCFTRVDATGSRLFIVGVTGGDPVPLCADLSDCRLATWLPQPMEVRLQSDVR